jgi:hypothetical protein
MSMEAMEAMESMEMAPGALPRPGTETSVPRNLSSIAAALRNFIWENAD